MFVVENHESLRYSRGLNVHVVVIVLSNLLRSLFVIL